MSLVVHPPSWYIRPANPNSPNAVEFLVLLTPDYTDYALDWRRWLMQHLPLAFGGGTCQETQDGVLFQYPRPTWQVRRRDLNESARYLTYCGLVPQVSFRVLGVVFARQKGVYVPVERHTRTPMMTNFGPGQYSVMPQTMPRG